MKLVLAWLAALVVAGLTAASCSINHRSGEYECVSQADCKDGRVCTGGYCIVPGGVGIDAPAPGDGPRPDGPPDAPQNVCPAQCSSCNTTAKTCKIDCAVTNCTGSQPIVCPQGWSCEILCTTANSCRAGINCINAKDCNITCSGTQSCRTLVCGTGPCDIECTGTSSCRGINCSNSCACDVTCGDAALCEQVTCSDFTCRDQLNGGCTSQRIGCETCP